MKRKLQAVEKELEDTKNKLRNMQPTEKPDTPNIEEENQYYGRSSK